MPYFNRLLLGAICKGLDSKYFQICEHYCFSATQPSWCHVKAIIDDTQTDECGIFFWGSGKTIYKNKQVTAFDTLTLLTVIIMDNEQVLGNDHS